MNPYTFRGGEFAKKRLGILSRVLEASTGAVLGRAGIKWGMTALTLDAAAT